MVKRFEFVRAGRCLAWFASAAFATAIAGCSADQPNLSANGPVTSTASITPVTRSALNDIPGASGQAATGQSLPAMGGSGAPLKIGLLLPMGGFDQTAQIAKGMKQAAEMALFEGQRPNVQLIVKDDKGTPDGAKAAAEEAIKEGAEIVLGPLFSKSVPGAAAATRAANVPLLTFSNDRQVAGSGVFTLGFSPEQDAQAVAAYASAQNKKRFAMLLPDDGYGQVIGASFRQAVADGGGTVVTAETYPAGANAMIGPSRRIVEAVRQAEGSGAPIDALFVPGGQDVLPQLGPLLTYAGFDATKVKMLGSGAWEFTNAGSSDIVVGGWYPGPDPQGWRGFTGRFLKTYASPPPRMASVAFDAVMLAVSLAGEAPGQRFTMANLTRPAGFTGVDGILRLKPNGTAERELAILEVQKAGTIVIQAPGSVLQGAKLTEVAPSRVN